MIWEILFSLLLAALAYFMIRALMNEQPAQDMKTLPHEEFRELGMSETVFHNFFKMNTYHLSCNIIVNSRIPMDNWKVKEALQILAKRHPLLQAAIKEVHQADGKHYHFTRMPSFKIDYQQSDKSSTEPSHWEDVMPKNLLEPINDRDGPLWRCCRLKEFVDTQSSKVTNCFVFTFHHSIIDGISMTKLFEEFLRIVHRLHKNETVKEMAYDMRSSTETLLADMIRPKWWTRIAIKVLETLIRTGLYSLKSKEIDVYFNKYPVVCNVYPDIQPENRAIFTCFSKSETKKLLHACKEHGCTVNGALTAAANMAMADILQDGRVTKPQWIPSKYTVNIRRHIELEENMNTEYLGLCAAAPKLECWVPCYDVQSFSTIFWKMANDITVHVHKTIETQSHLQDHKILQCFSLSFLETIGFEPVYEHQGKRCGDYLFGISNFGHFFKGSKSDCLFDVEKLFICPAQHNHGSLFVIFFVSVNEKLCCSYNYCPHVTAESQAEEFNNKLLQNLRRAFNDD